MASYSKFQESIEKWIQTGKRHKALEILAALVIGLGIGLALVLSRSMDESWAVIVVVGLISLGIGLLIKNPSKIFLVLIVLDLVLGLDFTYEYRRGHLGGPDGLQFSLVSFVILFGYVQWVLEPKPRRETKLYPPLMLPIFFFLVTVLISFFQVGQDKLWFSFSYLFLLSQYILMYIYLLNYISSWAEIRLIVITISISLFIESLIMILQYYFGFQFVIGGIKTVVLGTNRVGGTFAGPNHAATFLAAAIAITYSLYLSDKFVRNKWLALIPIITGFIALIFTKSRGAWVGVILAIAVISVFAIIKGTSGRRLFVLFFVLVLIGAVFSGEIVERLTEEDTSSAESRIWYNTLAWNSIQDNFFTGVGINNQEEIWEGNRYLPYVLYGTSRRAIHNALLTFWVELGIFGFLAFLWLITAGGVSALKYAFRSKRGQAPLISAGLAGGLIAIAWHMQVATFLERRVQFLWLIFSLIAVMNLLPDSNSAEPTS